MTINKNEPNTLHVKINCLLTIEYPDEVFWKVDVYIHRPFNRPYIRRYGLMVIEKNMAGTYNTITCGYVFMNIEDQSDR